MKNTLLKAATEAGKIIKENFEGKYDFESKENITSNIVTEIDTQAESKIIEIIKADFPDHGILSEEIGGIDEKAEIKWVIDPIDGTINFAHNIPLCCVSIGIEKQGEIIMGAVYNPNMNELFFAEKGQGAFLNDKKISVSTRDNFELSLFVTGFPYDNTKNNYSLDAFGKIVKMNIPLRRLGSAALDICWVACGRFEGFWEYDLKPWDVAAGYIIAKEAGASMTDFSNNDMSIYGGEILATNGLVHNRLLEIISNASEGNTEN